MTEQDNRRSSPQTRDILNTAIEYLTPVSMEKREERAKWINDFFSEYDTSIIELSAKEQKLEEQYRAKCYGMLPSELRKGALEQLDMGGRTVITQWALSPLGGISLLAVPPIASLYYNKKVDEYLPKELPKLTGTDWVLGTLGYFLVGTTINPISFAGLRNYFKARAMLSEIKMKSGDTKAPSLTNESKQIAPPFKQEQKSTLPLTSQKEVSQPNQTLQPHQETLSPNMKKDYIRQFNEKFIHKASLYSEKEKVLHAKMRQKLDGLWPDEFKSKAEIQFGIGGVSALGLSVIHGPTLGIFPSDWLEDALVGVAYEAGRRAIDPRYPKLNAFDWIVGIAIPFANPVLVGGIRNLWKSSRVMKEIELKKQE